MENEERNKKYNAYVKAKSPQTRNWPTLFYSFLIGGLICCIGQAISDIMQSIWPEMTDTELGAWTLVVLIFITCLLTGIGVFDDIAKFAGAGTIVPITGFANSICSSAMEYRREGIIFGMCVKMFTVAGPVIVCGVVSSILVGIVYLFIWEKVIIYNLKTFKQKLYLIASQKLSQKCGNFFVTTCILVTFCCEMLPLNGIKNECNQHSFLFV